MGSTAIDDYRCIKCGATVAVPGKGSSLELRGLLTEAWYRRPGESAGGILAEDLQLDRPLRPGMEVHRIQARCRRCRAEFWEYGSNLESMRKAVRVPQPVRRKAREEWSLFLDRRRNKGLPPEAVDTSAPEVRAALEAWARIVADAKKAYGPERAAAVQAGLIETYRP
jgi:hypothetical protein